MFILSLIQLFQIGVCLVMNSMALTNHSLYFKDDILSNLEKCCPENNVLRIGEKCINSTNTQQFQISPTKLSRYSIGNNCSEDLDCVDIKNDGKHWQLVRISGKSCQIQNIAYYNYFPKCCPIEFSYNCKTHNCVHDGKDEFADYLQVIKVSLSHCPILNYAIVDFDEPFEIDQDKNLKLTKSGQSFNYGNYCIERNVDNENYLIRACMDREKLCGSKGRRCLWKCCPDGAIYEKIEKSPMTCKIKYSHGIDLSKIDPNIMGNQEDLDYNFSIITSNYLKNRMKLRYREDMHFKIDALGAIENKVDYEIQHFPWHSEVYCIETVETINSTTQVIYIFHNDTSSTAAAFNFQGIILFVSSIFLIVTILCYLFLPEMKNLHGKCIMMECIFLLTGSAILCSLKIFSIDNSSLCIFLGYGTIYTFLGVFAWLNVICVDMWMTFGVLRGFNAKEKKEELRKFLIYTLYGFGVPTGIISIMLLVETTQILPETLVPHIGKTTCYFDINYPKTYDYLLYFIVPMALMLVINVVFFVKTAVYCVKVKNEIQRMREVGHSNEKGKRTKRFNSDKEKLIMLLKLFMLMGIPWVFEAVSTVVSFKENSFLRTLELIIDTFNCAKGFFIFCIFILKRKVLISIKNLFGIKTTRRQTTELSSLTMTTTTR